jgi:ribosomal protein S11
MASSKKQKVGDVTEEDVKMLLDDNSSDSNTSSEGAVKGGVKGEMPKQSDFAAALSAVQLENEKMKIELASLKAAMDAAKKITQEQKEPMAKRLRSGLRGQRRDISRAAFKLGQ